MLENEIKVVNEIINERKMYSISENILLRICKNLNANYKMVVSILENKYNAFYEAPFDAHFCGDYRFNNPNLQKQNYFILKYLFKDETNICNSIRVKASNNYSEAFAEEILLLDDKVKTSLEDIMKALEEKKAFIGEERIWFITSEMGY